MCFQPLVDLYWSKDFLLNISAEALGVVAEVILITLIIGRYVERRELQRWRTVFSTRVRRILDEHRNMPTTIDSMAIAGDINLPHKIAMWRAIIEERVRDVLTLVPPTLQNPGYAATEAYLESLRELGNAFMKQDVPLATLRTLNNRAEQLARQNGQANPQQFLWTEDFLVAIEPELRDAEW